MSIQESVFLKLRNSGYNITPLEETQIKTRINQLRWNPRISDEKKIIYMKKIIEKERLEKEIENLDQEIEKEIERVEKEQEKKYFYLNLYNYINLFHNQVPTQKSLDCFKKYYPEYNLEKELVLFYKRTSQTEIQNRINKVLQIIKEKPKSLFGGRTTKRHRRASRKSSRRRVRRTRRRV